MIAHKAHYDPRWLVTRLSNGDTIKIRDIPEVVYYDVADAQCKNQGYWELSIDK